MHATLRRNEVGLTPTVATTNLFRVLFIMEAKDQHQVNQLRAALEKDDPHYRPDRFEDEYYREIIRLSREISPETVDLIRNFVRND